MVKPGKFIDMLLAVDHARVEAALEKTVADLRKPPYTKSQLLGALDLHGAKGAVRHFSKKWKVDFPPAQ